MSRALCRGILYLSLKLNHLYQISYTLDGFMLKSQIYGDVSAAFLAYSISPAIVKTGVSALYLS